MNVVEMNPQMVEAETALWGKGSGVTFIPAGSAGNGLGTSNKHD